LLEPEIPANTGSIGRLCLGTATQLHLVKPLGFRIDEKAVRRAGLDYWKDVDLVVHDGFRSVLDRFPLNRIHFASAREGVLYTEADFSVGDVFVFGRESTGLPESIRCQYPERFIRIPSSGRIRSLNLASAASVLVYEGLRQVAPPFFR